ncbi:Cilia- and flagella-associated protein 69 [Liparis tanakae]|uniref:Cilia-and flagella-associated protein 69 n=1 Tax=Liparis tanakae TaxID=230148 RepID=A0A4Z2FR18_9TELE|nr:Cilia- and flagella-associated protein 69 [Liparis tanakae]
MAARVPGSLRTSRRVPQVGEVWEEIRRELTLDGVRPITPDEEALSAICRMAADTARRVAAEQSGILEQQEKEDAGEEELLYTEMKSHWKQRELTAKSWDRYVSRTSNYDILKEVKAQREEDIEASRADAKHPDAAAHRKEHFVGQVMSVERTGAEGPAGAKVTIARVPIEAAGPDPVGASTQDPEYFSTVSVTD